MFEEFSKRLKKHLDKFKAHPYLIMGVLSYTFMYSEQPFGVVTARLTDSVNDLSRR